MARAISAAAMAGLVLVVGGCALGDPVDDPAPTAAAPTVTAPTAQPAAAPAHRVEGTRMSGQEIRGALVGRELVARNLDTETVNTVWLTPDKRVKWVKGDRITFGAWRIDGDRLCFSYDDPERGPTCTEIYRQAAGEFLSVVDGEPRVRIRAGRGY